MNNQLNVYPTTLYRYNKRQKYIAEEGTEFTGLRAEALSYFQQLNPSKSIILHYAPKKRF